MSHFFPLSDALGLTKAKYRITNDQISENAQIVSTYIVNAGKMQSPIDWAKWEQILIGILNTNVDAFRYFCYQLPPESIAGIRSLVDADCLIQQFLDERDELYRTSFKAAATEINRILDIIGDFAHNPEFQGLLRVETFSFLGNDPVRPNEPRCRNKQCAVTINNNNATGTTVLQFSQGVDDEVISDLLDRVIPPKEEV